MFTTTLSIDAGRRGMKETHDPPLLARKLAVAYCLLIVYASLYPVVTWRDNGIELLAFLSVPWPRYWTALDLGLNILAYIPLGFLLTAGLVQWQGKRRAALLAFFLALALSLCLEVLQNYLPSRIPSNVDLLTNGLGGLLGTLCGLLWGHSLHAGGTAHRWRVRHLHHGIMADYGLVLALLWLLTQLSPEILLFGTGNVRHLLGLPPALDFTVERFLMVEGSIAAGGVLGAGLLVWRLMRLPQRWPVFAFLLLALAIRSGSAVLLLTPEDLWRWATPGARYGLALGLLLLYGATFLPRVSQQSIAALVLVLTAIVVNLAPENPYLLQSQSVWRQGHFLNFNGLTRLVASIWPFLALVFLVAAGPRQEPPPGIGKLVA